LCERWVGEFIHDKIATKQRRKSLLLSTSIMTKQLTLNNNAKHDYDVIIMTSSYQHQLTPSTT